MLEHGIGRRDVKYRHGFVSNSSSSSFMLAFKGKITKERLMEWLGVRPGAFMYSFCGKVADYILSSTAWVGTLGNLAMHYGFNSVEEMKGSRYRLNEISLIEQGYNLLVAEFEDFDGNSIEGWLASKPFTYRSESDDLIIENVR